MAMHAPIPFPSHPRAPPQLTFVDHCAVAAVPQHRLIHLQFVEAARELRLGHLHVRHQRRGEGSWSDLPDMH